ncbi:hypothetical protein [Candidatus Reidiella endopervernicosa]|uniref:Uncharacterized protein n=1 Tax=Candidatus Reidiella endopervernicosa TaxID=2738883 RepID=A0A6N0HWP5_9GAMM|nr:hypothetical protein [Candidatus Reidiella endopervernicosa]QKQ26576.1 hypothetical protein HUE57_10020 [Candidatus Reidiella endopervernicosa]
MSGYLQAGFGWDSNVTRGPDEPELDIPDLGVTSMGDAAAASDRTSTVEGVSQHAIRLMRNSGCWVVPVCSATITAVVPM